MNCSFEPTFVAVVTVAPLADLDYAVWSSIFFTVINRASPWVVRISRVLSATNVKFIDRVVWIARISRNERLTGYRPLSTGSDNLLCSS